MAREPRLRRRQIERQRLPASVAPNHPARAPPGPNLAEVRVAPGEIERYALTQRRRHPCRQHPGKTYPAPARDDGRCRRKHHPCFADPGTAGTDTGPDERPERTEPRNTQPGQVDKGGQHAGER